MASSSAAKEANKGDIETGRIAAELVRQITLSRSRDINRSNSKSRDLELNSEKDATTDPSHADGILGGIMKLLSNLPEWLKYLLAAIAWIAYPAYQRLRKAEDRGFGNIYSRSGGEGGGGNNKLATDIAEALPNDGKLKDAVKTVGEIAHKVDKDAETAQAFIKMVDELGDDLDEYINPLIKVGDLFMKEKIEEKKEKKQQRDQSELAIDAKL